MKSKTISHSFYSVKEESKLKFFFSDYVTLRQNSVSHYTVTEKKKVPAEGEKTFTPGPSCSAVNSLICRNDALYFTMPSNVP